MIMRTTFEILRQTLVHLLQNRLLWVLIAAQIAIAIGAYALGFAVHENMSGRSLYALIGYWALNFSLLPWTTMYFGVQAVHGDIEDRTAQYLFLRPVSRVSILLGKWLATALLSAIVYAFGAVVLLLGLAAHTDRWPNGVELHLPVLFATAMALAAVAYAAVAAWFSARFKRPLVWAAFFIVGLQMIVGTLPARAGIRLLTIADPVRRYLLDGLDPDPRLARALWPTERNFDPELIGEPVWNLAILTGAALLLALLAYVRTEYDARQRE